MKAATFDAPADDNNFTLIPDSAIGTPQWSDVRGTSFDALDRAISSYELAFGTVPKVTNTYDAGTDTGLLSSSVTAAHQQTAYLYDPAGRTTNVNFTGTAPVAPSRSMTFDLDGRTASISAAMGTIAYAYDLDGHETSVTEPATQIQASLICYNYYPDGQREYLSIGPATLPGCSSIATTSTSQTVINQQNVLSYAYQGDGLLSTQTVNWNTQGSFSWTYTLGGRELTQKDPLTTKKVTTAWNITPGSTTYVAKQYAYDAYGRVSQMILPEGYTADTYAYDTDDDLLGYNTSAQTAIGGDTVDQGMPVQFTMNARGELISPGQSANGTIIGGTTLPAETNPQAVVGATQIESRTGMTLANTSHGPNTYTYDAAGRQSIDTLTPPSGSQYPGPYVYTRTYDAENHLVTAPEGPACNPNALTVSASGCPWTTATFTWGPDGHLRHIAASNTIQSPPTSETFDEHWDGDTLLFQSLTSGTSTWPVLYIGKLATLTGSTGAFTVADRDASGIVQSVHTSTAYSAWNVASVVHTSKVGNVTQNPGSCYGTGALAGNCPEQPDVTRLGFDHADGYTWGPFSIQGVRVHDDTSQQWLSPDAYAGDAHDPMSQKPFMYNDNNPVEYSDPSGYDPNWFVIDGLVGAIPHMVSDAIQDARTATDSHASPAARVLAAASFASNFVPEIKEGAAIGKTAIVASEHLLVRMGERDVSSAAATQAVEHGTQYNDANYAHLDGIAHVGDSATVHSQMAADGSGVRKATSVESHKKTPNATRNRINSGRYTPRP